MNFLAQHRLKAITLAVVLIWLVGRILGWPFSMVGGALLVAWLVALAWITRDHWIGWFRRKWREWSTDLKQLGLWASLAFKPKRDAQAAAAMVHQQSFLDGRILSPVNVFTYVPLIVAFISVVGFGFQSWRVGQAERARDAPCSNIELSTDSRGNFRTTRASCAALGATNDVAEQWADKARELETEMRTAVATARREWTDELARQQREAQARQALAVRARRRENEGIAAALGGPAPDLERSLCELAGRVDCAPAAPTDGSATPPAASGVSGDTGNPGAN